MLSKQDILKYLVTLNTEMAQLQITGEIILFGGASMCLVYDARTSTKDIDALYEPNNKVLPKTQYVIEEIFMEGG